MVSVMICTGGSSAVKGVTKKQRVRRTVIQGSLSDSVTWALAESDIKNCRPRVLGRRTMMNIPGVDCGILHLTKAKDGCLLPLRSSCGAQQETFGGLGWSK